MGIPRKPKDVQLEKPNKIKEDKQIESTTTGTTDNPRDSKLTDTNTQSNEILANTEKPEDLCKQIELEKTDGFDTPTNLEEPQDVLMTSSENDVEVGQRKANLYQPLPQTDTSTTINLETNTNPYQPLIRPDMPNVINPYQPSSKPEMPNVTNPYQSSLKPEMPTLTNPYQASLKPEMPNVTNPYQPYLKTEMPNMTNPYQPLLQPEIPNVTNAYQPLQQPEMPTVTNPYQPLLQPEIPNVTNPYQPCLQPEVPNVAWKPKLVKAKEMGKPINTEKPTNIASIAMSEKTPNFSGLPNIETKGELWKASKPSAAAEEAKQDVEMEESLALPGQAAPWGSMPTFF